MIEAGTRRYLHNLDAIAAACRPIGARLIVVTQQARSLMIEPDRLQGTTYDEEARFVLGVLDGTDTRGTYNAMQLHLGAMFAVHSHLMQAIRAWAQTTGTPLVDGIAVLDHQRDLVRTWVHLAPAANKRLALAIGARIMNVAPGPAR
jgi:hypothetical protein